MNDHDHDDRVREKLGTAPRPATALQDLAEWGRRHRAVAILLGSLVFLLGALLVWWGQGRDESARDGAHRSAVLEEKLARSEARVAQTEASRCLALSELELPKNPTLALQLAVEGARTLPGRRANDLLYRVLDEHREIVRLYGHDGAVLGFEVLPDDRVLTWDATGLIQVWSLAERTAVRRHVVEDLRDVAWIEGPSWIVASTTGGALHVLRGSDEASVVADVSPRPLGRVAALPGEAAVVVGSEDGNAYLVELDGMRTRAVLSGHEGGVDDVAVDPQGITVATIGADDRVRLWDAESGDLRLTHEAGLPGAYARVGAPGRVAILDEGDVVVAWSPEGVTRAWATKGGPYITSHGDAAYACSPFGLAHEARCIAFRRQHRGVAGGDAEVWVHDLDEATAVARFRGVPALPLDTGVTLDRKATRIAIPVSPGGALAVRALPSGVPLAEMPGGHGPIAAARFIENGTRLLLAGEDRAVRMLEVVPQPARDALAGRSVRAFSADGRRAVVGGKDEEVRVLDTETGQVVRALDPGTDESLYAFAADASAVAYTTRQGGLQVVGLDAPDADWQVEDLDAPASLAMADGGARVALRTGRGDLLVVERNHTRTFEGLGARPFVLSTDGRWLAALGAATGPPTTVFDLDAEEASEPIVLSDHPCSVACFDPDGRALVVNTGPGLLAKIDLGTREVVAATRRGRPFVALAVSADGAFLIAMGPRRVTLRSFEDLEEIGSAPLRRAPLHQGGFDAGSTAVVAATKDGLVRLRPVRPLAHAESRRPAGIDPRARLRLGIGTPVELHRAWTAYVAAQPSAQGAFELGRARVEARRPEEARADFALATKLRPDLALGRYGLLLVAANTLATALPETGPWNEARAKALPLLDEVLGLESIPAAGLRADPLLGALWRVPEAAARMAESTTEAE